MPRFLLSLLAAAALTTLATGSALAGGWAVVVPDPAAVDGPVEPVASEPVRIGFTLLQHGVTAVDDGVTRVTFRGAAGEEIVVTAESTGDGHWVASANLPTAGVWSWSVRMVDGLEIVPRRDTPSVTVLAAPDTFDALPIAGGLAAGVLMLLALLVAASRIRGGTPEVNGRSAPQRV